MQTRSPGFSQIHVDTEQLDALETGCGLIRWSTASLIEHSGSDALDLLHRLTTRELLSVGAGRSKRTVLTSDRGRVVDVFLVAHLAENRLLLISDSNKPERTISAIDYYTIIEDAELVDLSESHTRFSLVGSRAIEVCEVVLGVTVGSDEIRSVDFAGDAVIVASDTSRGVVWLDLVCPKAVSENLARALQGAGTTVIDDDHFELFRIDHEIPGLDQEYGEHANPIEAGLLGLIDFDKGCYVGQEVIARLDAYDKVQRELRVLESDSLLEVSAKLSVDSVAAGIVTSASSLEDAGGKYLSLALVRKAFAESGTLLSAGATTVTVR